MNDNTHDGSKDLSSDNKSIYANENKVVNDQNERRFRVTVDNVPYSIKVIPFQFNDQIRYYVTVNEGPQNIFVWDTEMLRFTSITNQASLLPDGLMLAISNHLKSPED